MEETAARLYRRELQSRGGKREMDPGTQLVEGRCDRWPRADLVMRGLEDQ